jgi:NAD(P)H dehydrogenase (quinone)
MSKILIAYTTQTGNTREIAQIIAEGCRFAGAQATVKTVQEIADPTELQDFDAVVLGSATYNSRMMDEMEQFLDILKSVNLDGKTGGAFGAYGWSGEAPDLIYKAMKDDLNMKLVNDSLRLKQVSLPGGMKMAQDYGRAVCALAQV